MRIVFVLVYVAAILDLTFAGNHSSHAEEEIEKAPSGSSTGSLARQEEIYSLVSCQASTASSSFEKPPLRRSTSSGSHHPTHRSTEQSNGCESLQYSYRLAHVRCQPTIMAMQPMQSGHESDLSLLWPMWRQMAGRHGPDLCSSATTQTWRSRFICRMADLHRMGRTGLARFFLEAQVPESEVSPRTTTQRRRWKRSSSTQPAVTERQRKGQERQEGRTRRRERDTARPDRPGTTLETSSTFGTRHASTSPQCCRDPASTASPSPAPRRCQFPEHGSANDLGKCRTEIQPHRGEGALHSGGPLESGPEAIGCSPTCSHYTSHQLEHTLVGVCGALERVCQRFWHLGHGVLPANHGRQGCIAKSPTDVSGKQRGLCCNRSTPGHIGGRERGDSRDGDGQRGQCYCDPRGLEHDGDIIGRSPTPSCRAPAREKYQTGPDHSGWGIRRDPSRQYCRGQHRRKRRWSPWQSFLGAFWWGQSIDSSEIACPKAHPYGWSRVQRWTHSVTELSDFQAPWQSAEKAVELAYSLGFVGTAAPLESQPTSSRRQVFSQVRFNEELEVFLGTENDVHMHKLSVEHFALQDWTEKPWSLQQASQHDRPLDYDDWGSSRDDGSSRYTTSYEFPVAGMPQHNRPSLTSMPDWVQDLWRQFFARQADITGYREDGPSVTFITWFLHETHDIVCRRPRWCEFNVEYEHWATTIQDLWRDRMDFDLDYDILLVEPEPPRACGENHQGHLLVAQRARPHLSKAILLSAQLVTAHSRLSRSAFLTSPVITRDTLLRLDRLTHDCAILDCTVMARHDVITDFPVPIQDGEGIIVYGTGRMASSSDPLRTHMVSDEEDDFSSLLATNSLFPRQQDPQEIVPAAPPGDSYTEDSSTPEYGYDVNIDPDSDWISAVLFTRDGDGVVGRIQETHPELEHREVAYMLGITVNSLIAIHHVGSPPQDLIAARQSGYIVQKLNDIPMGSHGRLVLVDVLFCAHLPQLEPETIRQVKVIPHSVSTEQIKILLRLHRYCSQPGVFCLMHLNNDLLRSDRDLPLDLSHGDYLRVTLSPPPGCHSISTRLACLARFHGLSEAAFPHLGLRLPHTMHLDQVPNPAVYLEDLAEAESFSLLQVSALQAALMLSEARAPVGLLGLTYPDTPQLRRDLQHKGHSIQCRVPDDPSTQLEPYFAQNERLLNAAREARRLQGWLHLPVGLQDLHAMLLQTWEPFPDQRPWIQTWYLNHRTAWRCNIPRPWQLPSEESDWLQSLGALWQDEIDPNMPMNYHLVWPQPYDMELGVQAHLLVVQPEDFELTAILITMFDSALFSGHAHRFAVLHRPLLSYQDLLDHADRDQVCTWPGVVCTAWFGWDRIDPQMPLPLQSGYGITLTIERPPLEPEDPGLWNDFAGVDTPPDALGLLQTRSTALHRKTLHLASLLDTGACLHLPTARQAFRIHNANLHGDMPSYLDFPMEATAADVELELSRWGHQVRAHLSHEHGVAFCFDLRPLDLVFGIIYVHEDLMDTQGCFLHWSQQVPTELSHMRFLHSIGYLRSVVVSEQHLWHHVILVRFHNARPELEVTAGPPRPTPAWPSQQPCLPDQPMFEAATLSEQVPASLLTLPDAVRHLQGFFDNSTDFLQKELPDIPFPDCVLDAYALCEPLDRIDRYLVFTDGSSICKHKHAPTAWVTEFDAADSWAFVVIGEQYGYGDAAETSRFQFIGWTSQLVVYEEDAPHHIGTTTIGSTPAEREALFWAGQWRLSLNKQTPTIFLTDSQVGKAQASGQAGAATHDLSFRNLRATFQALEQALPRDCLQVQHIHGHCGSAWNEAADTLAKHECRHQFFVDRQPVDMRTWGRLLPHLWMFLHHGGDLPALTQHGFDIVPPDLPAPQPISSSDLKPVQRALIKTSVNVSFGSYNVRSLYRGPDGHQGKLQYGRLQFQEHHLNFLGLQEARTEAGSFCTDQVLRLATGHSNGQLGLELWVNLAQPYGQSDDRPLFFHRRHFTVVHADPRCLLVHVTAPHLDTWICVAHAPHCGTEEEVRLSWWMYVGDLLAHFCGDADLYLLLDANATTGRPDEISVFDAYEGENPNTSLFRALLDRFSLGLPSTSSRHQGPRDTWTSPSGLHSQRIDYVAVKGYRLGNCTMSGSLESMDFDSDHVGVALQLTWPTWAPPSLSWKPAASKPSYDKEAIRYHSGLHSDLQDGALPPWHCDIESHVAVLNDRCLQSLHHYFPPQRRSAKKIYMTSELWDHRLVKQRTRKTLKLLRGRSSRLWLQACFAAWRSSSTSQTSAAPGEMHHNYFSTLICCTVKHLAQLHNASLQLRRGLRATKMTLLQQRLKELPSEPSASSLISELRPFIGPTNPKKRKCRGRPYILKPDGHPCQDAEDIMNCWIHFFQVMEGGERMPYTDLRESWTASLAAAQAHSQTIPMTEVPTLLDLELAYRRVASRKATGDDAVPGELCRSHPAAMARMAYGPLLKLVCQGQEALIHKGGTLVPVWKQKGSQSLVQSYRSILVSSHMGKGIHRAIRQHQQDLYTDFLHSGQIGGRPHVPVGLGMHLVRAHLRTNQLRKHSCSLLFLDLTEAFYRVIRQLVIAGPITDAQIAQVAARIGLPDSILHDFQQTLRAPTALNSAALAPHMQRAVQMLHDHTHFRVDSQSDVVKTTIGTRPGDCWADVVFGFLFSRILQKLETRLHQEGFLEAVPPPAPHGLFAHIWERHGPASDRPELISPTWMDDLCLCLDAPTGRALEQKTLGAASALLDICAQHLVSPNLNKGKTEVIMIFRGPGSRQLRTHYYGPAQGGAVPILYEYGSANLNVVGEYQHLGGLIHHTGITKKEVARRIGIANNAFNQHRRLLFQNEAISFAKRRQLFESLILSKLCYGTETWVIQDLRTWRYFEAALIRLYRRLLRLPGDRHCTDLEILGLCGLPPATQLLRRARLRYLATLYACEDAAHWTLILNDQLWMSLVHEDLGWLGDILANTCSLGTPSDHLGNWDYVLRWHRPYWKRLLRRAFTLDCLKRTDAAYLFELHRRSFDLLISGGTLAYFPDFEDEVTIGPFACLRCQLLFKSKAGEKAHMFKCHHQINPLRFLFDGTQCSACLKECYAHSKLLAHLRNTRACRTRLLASGLHCVPAPGSGSQRNTAQLRAHNGLLPLQQGAGPLPEEPRPGVPGHHHLLFIEAVADACLEAPTAEDLLHCLQDLGPYHCLSWTDYVATIELFIQDFDTDMQDAPLPLGYAMTKEALRAACEPHSWQFMHEPLDRAPSGPQDPSKL